MLLALLVYMHINWLDVVVSASDSSTHVPSEIRSIIIKLSYNVAVWMQVASN